MTQQRINVTKDKFWGLRKKQSGINEIDVFIDILIKSRWNKGHYCEDLNQLLQTCIKHVHSL